MSYNRLQYDKCAYDTEIKESVSVLGYTIFKPKYVHKQCLETDISNEVSFVDRTVTENELYGIDRRNSLCPSKKFNPDNNFVNPKYSPNRICESIYSMTPTNLEKPSDNMIKNPDLNIN